MEWRRKEEREQHFKVPGKTRRRTAAPELRATHG
ncbi:hypothetical protein ABIE16_000307 [Pseudomonas sp. 2725]